MRSFRRELKMSLEPILADLAAVRAKFKNKAYVEEGRLHAESGLLMGDFNEYLECLFLNPEHLERMLLSDEQAWQEKLNYTKHLLLNTEIPMSHVMQQPKKVKEPPMIVRHDHDDQQTNLHIPVAAKKETPIRSKSDIQVQILEP